MHVNIHIYVLPNVVTHTHPCMCTYDYRQTDRQTDRKNKHMYIYICVHIFMYIYICIYARACSWLYSFYQQSSAEPAGVKAANAALRFGGMSLLLLTGLWRYGRAPSTVQAPQYPAALSILRCFLVWSPRPYFKGG